ncbi:MAG: Zn-ribbon domain-containing OB-fold protein [Planctomycetes bacterium]|nr:Zn-ribbon domain-containing OB-fold protein [Planctomycetota bacterium]
MKNLRGTGLKEKDFEREFTVYYKPQLEYRWDTGLAIGKFLEGLRDGKLFGKKCNKCKRILFPPRAFCERCFVDTDEWIEVKDTGTINTYSLCYITWDMKQLKDPQIPAVIEIDGSSGGFLHIAKIDPKQIKIGMKVQAIWKRAGERTGSITDIKYFVAGEE